MVGDFVVLATTISTFLVVDALEEGAKVVLATTIIGLELVETDDALLPVSSLCPKDVVVLLLESGDDDDDDDFACLFVSTVSFVLEGKSYFVVECNTTGFGVVTLLDTLAIGVFTLPGESGVEDFVVGLESSTNTTTVLGSFSKFLTVSGLAVVDECCFSTCFEEGIVELTVAGLCVVDMDKSIYLISEFLDTTESFLSPSKTLLTTWLISDKSSSSS